MGIELEVYARLCEYWHHMSPAIPKLESCVQKNLQVHRIFT